jgi:hypothetical protein
VTLKVENMAASGMRMERRERRSRQCQATGAS